jgi:hypothetical protein
MGATRRDPAGQYVWIREVHRTGGVASVAVSVLAVGSPEQSTGVTPGHPAVGDVP